jgi:hypothetical protein
LPGEPETSDDLEDARHWTAVYRELLAGFRDLAKATPKTHRAARLRQLRQLELRFRFWDTRCRELTTRSVKAELD